MDRATFGIFTAVRDAYLFAIREWLYLLKLAVMPMTAQILLSLFVQFQLKGDVGMFGAWLWGFPATALTAWFSFTEVRLLLLGERIDHLKLNETQERARHRAMRVSVLVALLFNMGLFLMVAGLMTLAASGLWGVDVMVTLAGLLLIGAMFWSLRFALLPILASVEYPFKPFLSRVRGPLFSCRLLGLGAAGLFPVAIVFQLFAGAFLGGALEDGKLNLTSGEQVGLIVASAFLSLIVTAILNAAGAFALKQMLGARGVDA